MRKANPVYIPRNHQIEAAIREGEDHGNFEHFHKLMDVLEKPYQYRSEKDEFILGPKPKEVVHQTFCGTRLFRIKLASKIRQISTNLGNINSKFIFCLKRLVEKLKMS